MKLGAYLKQAGLDEAAFAALSEGTFSQEAVRKWRFGARVPRREHLHKIAEITRGLVTANDFVGTPTDRVVRPGPPRPVTAELGAEPSCARSAGLSATAYRS